MKILIVLSLTAIAVAGLVYVSPPIWGQKATDGPTLIKRGEPTAEEREYSKEFRKLYPDQGNRVNRLLEIARKTGTREVVGSSIGEPTIPTVGGFTPPSESDFLTQLSCQADFIVIGKVLDKTAHLTDDMNFVYTQYQFVISEILKNNSRQAVSLGEGVQFTRPGGFVSLDNQLLRLEDKSYPPLIIGGRYLVFLRFVPGAKGFIVSTVEGTFDLSNGIVEQLRGRGPTELSKKRPSDVFESIRVVDQNGCEAMGR